MEARSAWCALEGRIICRVVPLVCSFVCYAFFSIPLALSLSLHRMAVHLLDLEGPEGGLKSFHPILRHVHWPM